MRTIHARYEDPLDRIWLTCAERIGLRIVREPGAYASTDGRGTLRIAVEGELDEDDSLAQMIFHELCHALVEGPASFEREDWGLDNTSDDDVAREHACVRAQAFLARPYGLGTLLAPTTDFRAFHDALGPDPLVRSEAESTIASAEMASRSIELARMAILRAESKPWSPHLRAALEATAAIARAMAGMTREHVDDDAKPSLWARVEPATARHPAGLPYARAGSEAASHRCGDCGFVAARGKLARCLKTRRRTRADAGACERWEPRPACETCGACCREAFDVLEVRRSDPFARAHRALLVLRDDGSFDLPRPQGRCPPLRGDGTPEAPYRCSIHAERPRTCRTFEVGGAACLVARRRVGLSV